MKRSTPAYSTAGSRNSTACISVQPHFGVRTKLHILKVAAKSFVRKSPPTPFNMCASSRLRKRCRRGRNTHNWYPPRPAAQLSPALLHLMRRCRTAVTNFARLLIWAVTFPGSNQAAASFPDSRPLAHTSRGFGQRMKGMARYMERCQISPRCAAALQNIGKRDTQPFVRGARNDDVPRELGTGFLSSSDAAFQ